MSVREALEWVAGGLAAIVVIAANLVLMGVVDNLTGGLL